MILLGKLFVGNSHALNTDHILIVVYINELHIIELSKYSMKKRGIPEENIMRLLTMAKERISRKDYEKKIVHDLTNFLLRNFGTICILIFNGDDSRV